MTTITKKTKITAESENWCKYRQWL